MGITISRPYLKAAYDLELYAISKLRNIEGKEDLLWKHTMIQSAGWLALKCGYIEQAKKLVEEGMKMSVDGYAKAKLALLKDKLDATLKEHPLIENSTQETILGLLIAADLEVNQINIKEKNSDRNVTLQVDTTELKRIVQLLLGANVEIETTTLRNGQMGLTDIRWAA